MMVSQDFAAPLPPGQVALRKITDPARIPDFRSAFALRIGLDRAAGRSLNYLSKPSSRSYFPYDPGGEITHRRTIRSLQLFRRTLAEAENAEQLDALVRGRFEVWESVGCDGRGTVLFTGYYCPIFEARLQPEELALGLLAIYDVQRAGVCSLELDLPAGYELRTGEGRDVKGDGGPGHANHHRILEAGGVHVDGPA